MRGSNHDFWLLKTELPNTERYGLECVGTDELVSRNAPRNSFLDLELDYGIFQELRRIRQRFCL